MPYGRVSLGNTGYPILCLASDPSEADWKVGGITIDWSTVTAVSADTTLPDGNLVKNGQKYLRYGQVLTRASTAEVQTATWTGGPTTGGAILRLPASGNDAAQDTTSISATATAVQFEDAIQALSRIGIGGVSVARTGSGTAGDPYVYTMTFNRELGDVPQFANVSNTFSGGTTPSSTLATTTAGTGTGMFGPYDPNATDGRQTLTRGDCFILNETVIQNVPIGWGSPNTDQPPGGVFDGGIVWKERLIVTSEGTGTLADGPTFTNFEAAFPRIGYVINP